MDTEETFFLALKSHRESNGIQLDEISEFTKINPKYLQAIEDGDFHIIPNVYMRLFIRSYCKYIEADYTQAIVDYELHTTGKIEPKLVDIDNPSDSYKNIQSIPKPDTIFGDNFQINYKQVIIIILTGLAIYLSFKLVQFISNDDIDNNSNPNPVKTEENLSLSDINKNSNILKNDTNDLQLLTINDFKNSSKVSEITKIIPVNNDIAIINLTTLQKTALNFSTVQKNGAVFF